MEGSLESLSGFERVFKDCWPSSAVLDEVTSSFEGISLGSFGMRILRRILWRDSWSRCQVLKGSLRIVGHPLPF